MYENDIFVIHSQSTSCQSEVLEDDTSELLRDFVNDYKNQKRVKLIIRILKPYIDKHLIVNLLDESMHLSDVISIFQNPSPKFKLSTKQIKFLKQIKSLNIKFPMTAVSNKKLHNYIF